MSEAVYSREVDVIWRLAPDRVLVRHAGIGSPGDTQPDGDGNADVPVEAADLMGLAALVWVALDEPAAAGELVDRLAAEHLDSTVEDAAATARQLVAAGWVRASVVGGV